MAENKKKNKTSKFQNLDFCVIVKKKIRKSKKIPVEERKQLNLKLDIPLQCVPSKKYNVWQLLKARIMKSSKIYIDFNVPIFYF